MVKKYWHYFLFVLLALDVAYSFCQHLHVPIDGDLANIILPSERYQPLMDNPFGASVMLENESYASPNRYFAHWFTAKYFRNIPIFLQNFTSPISSVYLSCAIIKTLIQVFLIGLLAMFITGRRNWLDRDFLIATALVFPLFQTTGYYHYMGVIDQAITYTLFYAFPLSLLLLFLFPFYQKLYFDDSKRWNSIQLVFLFVMTLFLSLNGPLIPAIVLLIVGLFFLFQVNKIIKGQGFSFFKNKIGRQGIVVLGVFAVFSMYSFYIGSSTTEGVEITVSVLERYEKLPLGVFNILTQKVGFPLLLLVILVNVLLIRRNILNTDREKMLTFLKWIVLFSVIYILLLPWGGYREYRPNILRRDTFLPITLCIMYTYGMTSYYLLKTISPLYKKHYVGVLLIIGLIFTSVDIPNFKDNQCEKTALKTIANSKKEVVELENDCLIMTWIKVEEPNFTKTNSQVLQLWNITEKPVLYFQK